MAIKQGECGDHVYCIHTLQTYTQCGSHRQKKSGAFQYLGPIECVAIKQGGNLDQRGSAVSANQHVRSLLGDPGMHAGN